MNIDNYVDVKRIIRKWSYEISSMLNQSENDSITIVHHNDADGICSASILIKFFEYNGMKPESVCIEKIHPKTVEKIHAPRENEIIVYTDLGAQSAHLIEKIDSGKNRVVIIDHHPSSYTGNEINVYDIDSAGISGDILSSASTLNYMLTRLSNEEMKDFAHIAVVGSVGDYHDRSGGLFGLNRIPLIEATEQDSLKVEFKNHRERYFIDFFEEYADVVSDSLTTMGVVGYYEKGYKKGINACLKRFDEKTRKYAEKLRDFKERKFNAAIDRLKENGLEKGKYVQWFDIGEEFSPMGVKSIGEFCQKIRNMSFLHENKYLVGFQTMENYVPDIGMIEFNASKMSGRVPEPLERNILSGKSPGLEYIVPKASEKVGGVADACHRVSAACLVPRKKEKEFVQVLDYFVEVGSNDSKS